MNATRDWAKKFSFKKTIRAPLRRICNFGFHGHFLNLAPVFYSIRQQFA
jgi:hypothetical protein